MATVGKARAVAADGVGTAHVLGLDIGGTKLAAGVVDQSGRVLSFAVSPTNAEEGPERGLERLFELGLSTVQQAGVELSQLHAVGIGAGGPLDVARGVLVAPPHLPGWRNVPIIARAERAFGVPVALENDATAAAAGEHRYGAGAGTSHMVYLTISTGVGGGVVIGGMTFRGAHGLGAELGHISINPDGPPCPGNCPNRGCLEAYCSGQALERDATELATDKPDSHLATLLGPDGKVSGRELVSAAEQGDSDALLLMENFSRILGVGIASYVNVFQPARFAIGGGMSRASGLFLDRAIREAESRVLPALWKRVHVALAEGGTDAGVIGAGVLAALEIDPDRDTEFPKATTSEGIE